MTRQPADAGPIERTVVHQVVVAQPLEPTERSLGHFKLHGVVKPSPTAEQLQFRVAQNVIGQAGPRRDLVREVPPEHRTGKFRKIAKGRNLLALEAQPEIQRERAAYRPGVLNEESMPVGAGVGHHAERRPQFIVAAGIVDIAVGAGAGAGTNRPVHHVVGSGVVVEDIVELVGIVDFVRQPVELPAKPQVVLAGPAGHIAAAQGNGALLLKILRRIEACTMSDGGKTTGAVQGVIG